MTVRIPKKTELQLRVGIKNACIILLGMDYEGDGRGGIFYWDNTSNRPDDDHNIVKVINIPIGRWIRATSGIVEPGDIEEITEILINNEEFITNIVNESINNEVVNINTVTTIINELNVEVQDINGKTLFYAFNPNDIDINPCPNPPCVPPCPDPPCPPLGCVIPETVKIQGNFVPLINSTESYSIEETGVGIANNLYIWTVVGGVIIGDANSTILTVEWGEDSSLSSVGVSSYCDEDNIVTDIEFFVLTEDGDGGGTGNDSITDVTGSSDCNGQNPPTPDPHTLTNVTGNSSCQ